ncbi:MAG: mycothiol system anti-sigma-R factor [Acidimicrobiales bacterium]
MAGRECDELLGDLADFLHGELTPDRREHLSKHLDDCPPCFETADFQAQLRALVAKRCTEQVPPDLKARIASLLGDPGNSRA